MAVTIGPIGDAPTPTLGTIGDRRIDLDTGIIWRNGNGSRWSVDERSPDDIIAALLAFQGSESNDAAWDALVAALVEGTNASLDVDDVAHTITIGATGGGGGGPATTRWEVVVAGTPPEAVTNADGTDWLYVEVPI